MIGFENEVATVNVGSDSASDVIYASGTFDGRHGTNMSRYTIGNETATDRNSFFTHCFRSSRNERYFRSINTHGFSHEGQEVMGTGAVNAGAHMEAGGKTIGKFVFVGFFEFMNESSKVFAAEFIHFGRIHETGFGHSLSGATGGDEEYIVFQHGSSDFEMVLVMERFEVVAAAEERNTFDSAGFDFIDESLHGSVRIDSAEEIHDRF